MTAAIQYRIQPKHPAAHLFEVRLTLARPAADGQLLRLPAWIPGSYMIREFARHIVTLRAECGGATVATVKLDKDTWRCAPCTGELVVTYEVYAWDLSVRAAHLDTTHGYFNGTSVFLQAVGQEQQPCSVEIAPPPGITGWRVATTLPSAGAAPWSFGAYRAADYDELVDHPVEMGQFSQIGFEACGVPHDVVITGRHQADLTRLAHDLRAICEQHIRFYGEPAPMDRYLFVVWAVGDGYGGLEHRSSTSLICKRDNLPVAGDSRVGEGYREFLGLCSHEYFHTWNVKRIKPAAFIPYDLSREGYTRQLWAFEGITSYYDDLALLRSGLITPAAYLELLGQTITRVLRGSGRFKQSVAESSFDAWTKFYRQDENASNAIVSYYTKGALVALALDLSLRRASDNVRSLDDVMRALWRDYGQRGQGVPEGGVEAAAAAVAGADLGDFFARYVHGTEDPPLADLLDDMGIAYALRPADSDTDKGGKPGNREAAPPAPRRVLGARLEEAGGELRVSQVFDGGAAQQAGLSAGDVLVAVDGLKASRARLEKQLALSNGPLALLGFRRDELMTFTLLPQPAPDDTCVLSLAAAADARRQAWRRAWWAQPD